MKLFETLKRLLEPRARLPMETTQAPTADRPPPSEPEPILETGPLAEPRPFPEPTPFAEPSPSDDIPVVVEASAAETSVAKTSDVSEVRALLEAVAEAPELAEPVAEAPAPTPPSEPTPTLFQESIEEIIDVPSAAPQRVGDALVLTLATPPATFTVAKAAATIGRGQENTIRLDDLSVSRRHARIAYKQGGYWLSDTGSMGGTWVDGARLNAPYRIAPGQIIDIGLCRLTVSFATSATSAASADKKETTRKPRSEVAAQVRRRR